MKLDYISQSLHQMATHLLFIKTLIYVRLINETNKSLKQEDQ